LTLTTAPVHYPPAAGKHLLAASPPQWNPDMYDIKQVTRYVLVRTSVSRDMAHAKDVAEFKGRDEAEAVMKALNGPSKLRGGTAAAQALVTKTWEPKDCY
jgi:hypothetical protein